MCVCVCVHNDNPNQLCLPITNLFSNGVFFSVENIELKMTEIDFDGFRGMNLNRAVLFFIV